MRWLRHALLALGILALVGCAAVTRAPAGPLKMGATQVTLGRDWADVSAVVPGRAKKVRVLSIDGPLLNRLYVSDALAVGDPLVKAAAKETPTPVIRADMSATERLEFVADSIGAMGYQRVETLKPRPSRYGGQPALLFDVIARTREGLDIQGLGMIAAVAGKTHVILYLAPAEHYFQANLPEVERVIASAATR